MGRQDDARAAVHPGQLLHGDGVAQGIQPGAAMLREEGDAHEAHLAQLPDGLVRELVLLVQHRRDGLISSSANARTLARSSSCACVV